MLQTGNFVRLFRPLIKLRFVRELMGMPEHNDILFKHLNMILCCLLLSFSYYVAISYNGISYFMISV